MYRLCYLLLLALGAALPCPAEDKWVEVRSPNFVVVSNRSQKEAAHAAAELEQALAVLAQVMPNSRFPGSRSIVVILARNEGTMRNLEPDKRGWGGPIPWMNFTQSAQKRYVAMRGERIPLDENKVIFWALASYMVNLNYGLLPPWLEFGLISFYAHTTISGDVAHIGATSRYGFVLLRQQSQIPMESLLTAEYDSPLVRGDKNVIFQLQAWALVHYLQLSRETDRRNPIQDLLQAFTAGVEPHEATRQILGDFRTLGKKLNEYIFRPTTSNYPVPTPPKVDESQIPSRELSPAEVAALFGAFHASRKQLPEARRYLEKAMQLDPKNVPALVSVGFLDFLESNLNAARQALNQAIALDPQNALAFYNRALLNTDDAKEMLDSAEPDLRRAIALDPTLAPALNSLAALLMKRSAQLQNAFDLARAALDLEPGSTTYACTAAEILLEAKHPDIANRFARLALLAASSKDERDKAQQLVDAAEKALTSSSFAAAPPPTVEPPPQSPQLKRRTAPARNAPPTAEGKISSVSCHGFALQLVVSRADSPIALHSENFLQVEYVLPVALRKKQFDPCTMLSGASAIIKLKPIQGESFAGEIVSIEVKQ